MIQKMTSLLSYLPIFVFYFVIAVLIAWYIKDKRQKQHSILKTHPILGRLRYLLEKVGPEFRQYWFLNDKEGKPVDRDTMETIAKAGKYGSTIIGFGSKKDFNESDFYLNNSMFPKNVDELFVDNNSFVNTYKYEILKEGEFSRKERRIEASFKPWHLKEDNSIIIGENTNNPFIVKGLIGVSAMSFGALSKSAVKALNQGIAISGGSWQNTGEGGLSPYHLSKIFETTEKIPSEKEYLEIYKYISKNRIVSNFEIMEHFYGEENYDVFAMNESNEMKLVFEMCEKGYLVKKETDLIFQIGSGLYGARDDNGNFSDENFLKNAMRPEVKAVEIKLAQGAKIKGGHLEGRKVNEVVAKIRNVKVGQTIESPNRHRSFHDIPTMFEFIKKLKDMTGKPVGIKIVVGSDHSLEEICSFMKKCGYGPDFITVDGGEGGTGATFQEMADRVGLPIYSSIVIVDNTLRKFGLRDDVKIIASGMLATADKMAIALALGADLINIARAAMNTIGCINAMKCHTNECPTGVTSHQPHLEAGLVVEEKRFRTANYLITMRQSLFSLGASCGISCPTLFNRSHVSYRDKNLFVAQMDEMYPYPKK